jgi:hypothetical protein
MPLRGELLCGGRKYPLGKTFEAKQPLGPFHFVSFKEALQKMFRQTARRVWGKMDIVW